jgi:tetratricopeptide (TPR) repeat protein
MGRSLLAKPGPVIALLAAVSLLAAAGATGQESGAGEAELLREASRLEASGDLEGAEAVLRHVVDQRPESLPALLALERVLRNQRRLDELLPLVAAAVRRERESALLNGLRIRTLSELDRVPALEAAAAEWIAVQPRLEVPYREIAGIWRTRGDYQRARGVLEEGRRRIDRPDALALELGDLYAELGEPGLAAHEWARFIDAGGRGGAQVRRRVRALPDGGAAVLPDLVDLLSMQGASVGRLEAALDLALEGGLEERSWDIAERLEPSLTLEERRQMMTGIARRADGAGLDRLAYRAYQALLGIEGQLRYVQSGSATRSGRAGTEDAWRLVIRQRIAQLALALGDTAGATTSYVAVEETFAPGSPERRMAAGHRIGLVAVEDPDRARELLQAFVTEFPGAAEVDELSATVARALVEDGHPAEAEQVLAGIDGPRSAMERGRLLLENGRLDAARVEYQRAATGLTGGEATDVLTLVTLLTRLPARGGALVGLALRLVDAGQPGEAVDRVLAAANELDPADRPPLLDYLAGLAEGAGLERDAREIRHRIVAEHPDSGEAPGALLALARDLQGDLGAEAEARELLERLIIEYPRSALVPQARRELERLGREGAG